MKHYPTPDKSNGSLADHQYQLCNQYQYDETEVIRGNSNVYNGLCQKREQKAQEAAGEESEQYLKNQFPVWPEIAEEKSQPVLLRYFSLFLIKIRGGFDQQSDTCRFPCNMVVAQCLRNSSPEYSTSPDAGSEMQ